MFLDVLWNSLAVVGALFQLVIIWALLQGPYKKYPLILLYCLVRLASTGVEYGLLLSRGISSPAYRYAYWIDDGILKLLMFLLVIVLTYQAMEGNPNRAAFGRMLGLIVVAVMLIPFIAFPERVWSGRWATRTSGLFAFSAALLNFAMWTALLKQSPRDNQLMLLSAGLGLEVTGEAIAHSLRGQINNPNLLILPNLLIIATHFLCLYIWWRALKHKYRAVNEAVAEN